MTAQRPPRHLKGAEQVTLVSSQRGGVRILFCKGRKVVFDVWLRPSMARDMARMISSEADHIEGIFDLRSYA